MFKILPRISGSSASHVGFLGPPVRSSGKSYYFAIFFQLFFAPSNSLGLIGEAGFLGGFLGQWVPRVFLGVFLAILNILGSFLMAPSYVSLFLSTCLSVFAMFFQLCWQPTQVLVILI